MWKTFRQVVDTLLMNFHQPTRIAAPKKTFRLPTTRKHPIAIETTEFPP
jgi:hypothetical protein